MNKKLLMCSGAGDFFAAEAYWTEKEREELKEIYWLAPVRKYLQPLLEIHPIYQKCKHTVIREVIGHSDIKIAPKELHKFNVFRYFGLILGGKREYVGSSFMQTDLARISHFDLPSQYVVIQPSTPINTMAERSKRDLRSTDWKELMAYLDERDLPGVVLNSEKTPIPRSRRLINLQGKTTLAESIEILKAGVGFAGIDSCLSILAGSKFASEDLRVFTRNPWLVCNAPLYYGPREDYSFLRGHDLTPEKIKQHRSEGGVFVRVLEPLLIKLRSHDRGEIVPTKAEVAEKLVKAKKAEYCDPE